MLPKKRPLTKWSRVVRRSSCLMSSTTSGKVREIIGWTLVCVSIHLECLLDKSRVEVVTWAAVGVANQQQFSYNSVSKLSQCEHDQCGFNSHSMRIGWMRIQFAFNQIKCEKAFIYMHYATCSRSASVCLRATAQPSLHVQQSSDSAFWAYRVCVLWTLVLLCFLVELVSV